MTGRRRGPSLRTARALNDPAHTQANLYAAAVGFMALTGFAIYEHAAVAYAVYCATAAAAFLPGNWYHLGKLTVLAAFVLAVAAGQWRTAVAIAAISAVRYISAVVAAHGTNGGSA
jgi:hypothetical protein